MSKNKTLSGGVAWFFISNLFPAISALLIFSLASRLISPSELGTVALATTIATVLTSLCAVGFGDALIQCKEITKIHLNTVFTVCICVSLFVYVMSVTLIETINLDAFTHLFRVVYPLTAFKIILDSCAIVPLSYLTRTMEFKSIALRTMYCSLASFILCIPILYYGGGVWAIVASQLTTSAVSFLILIKAANLKLRVGFHRKEFNELKKFGLTSTITKLITSISVDNLMIGFYGNAITLGLYAFSRRIFGVISDVLNNAIANVSYPLYASKQDNLNELKIIFLKTTFLSALISLPAFCGLILISPYLIPMVFGNQWEPAISVVQVCSAIGFISCIGALQMSLIKGLGHTSWILKYQIAQQVSTAILVLIFAKDGAYIVMLAIAIKTFSIWPFSMRYVSKILGVGIVDYMRNFVKPILAVSAMITVCVIIECITKDYGSLVILLSVILGGVISYILSAFLLARKETFDFIKAIKKR
ncbi:Capsule repeat unit export [Klebsiella pneumoniae subsp. rhinoscleromatis SB3432]|nr:oligosaccharide flippase family protein [Klebsiella pneumoniae]CBR79728.1 Capsule repeat unit export [Klebsiella pneumoniae subsp. rhinoscleromatis]CCI75824.1 Capsule repeat unit export [Klebsiella pneumoniae subsp. rhinoscleromatis SB3432]STT65545.1 Capsule repeat unit export [Klebsiella pneumoniae]STU08217.1 Capsule repeat unit export [Klebsiella pneumoniae]STV37635.1 Capsule repeat unit export [Klebsiella pneumoniae subsp. rhinoscleromatis]